MVDVKDNGTFLNAMTGGVFVIIIGYY